ncbi:bifunctional glycosyltransferase family 2/GtrA family protein [Thalassobacillus sp. CUG 92003]|uniref:bifunctional glycosyltransferase family 2/GtrA family protein n=1 Tax=Thalassobacillus sp. CUG 92003 TaxID=2736641 RepID=UPI0015E78319|nr:bifunctional glycosyltransferase family 2/GtrA family protein [Thalassobacillus sp. CUG 92003]
MTNLNQNVSVVIPAYNPDHNLETLISDLAPYHFHELIVVNDGSDEAYNPLFRRLTEQAKCVVLHHSENFGKGRALKTAFSYYYRNFPEGTGVVTADADGQHSPKDIQAVAEALIKQPYKLVLGVRDFSGEDIPYRSRFGNNLTKKVLRFTSGMNVTDTQTGLRGVPTSFTQELLEVEGDRYEFEMRMILACKTYNRSIEEVKIDTIYIDENKSSHFNPVVDSIKIYYVFFRFILSSGASFILDVGLFSLFSALLKTVAPGAFIVIATILARILSSLFNYFVNRNVVFKSKKFTRRTLVRYYTLATLILVASSAGVHYVYQMIGSHEVIIKIIVDSLLFLFSFYLQRSWVFDQSSVKEVQYE